MRGVLLVLTRREMSLNRRLFTWLLGTSDSESGRNSYFSAHAKAPLVRALQVLSISFRGLSLPALIHVIMQSLFAEETSDLNSALRPYKVATSLIHKVAPSSLHVPY